MLVAASSTDTATLILTSAVVAVVVSSIIGGAFTMWNDHLRREHETAQRADDREHERQMQLLDDRRRLRDAKAERLRHNLETLTDTALEVHTNVVYFIRNPDTEYKQVPELAAKMNQMLIGVRGKILVDADCAEVLEGLNDAYRRYQALGDAWGDYRTAQSKSEPGAPQMGKEAREEAGKLLSDLKDLIEKPRAILERYEQPIQG